MQIKNLLLVVVFVFGGLFAAKAEKSSVFQYDKNAVNKEMTQLNKVESYVNSHEGVTLNQLKTENNEVVKGLNFSSSNEFSSLNDGPVGIPSFIWGLCLSWVGILIVYLVTEDSDETKKALYGCIVGAVVWAVFYILFWVVFATSTV